MSIEKNFKASILTDIFCVTVQCAIGQQSYMLVSAPCALPESAVDEAVEDDEAEQRQKPVQRHVHVDHVYLG